MEPLRPVAEGLGGLVRAVGHGGQGRRRDARRAGRRRCPRLGPSRGGPSPAAADGSPIAPTGDSGEGARDGFEGSPGDRVRQPGLEDDMPRAVAETLKGEGPGHRRAGGDDGEEPERARRRLEDVEEPP